MGGEKKRKRQLEELNKSPSQSLEDRSSKRSKVHGSKKSRSAPQNSNNSHVENAHEVSIANGIVRETGHQHEESPSARMRGNGESIVDTEGTSISKTSRKKKFREKQNEDGDSTFVLAEHDASLEINSNGSNRKRKKNKSKGAVPHKHQADSSNHNTSLTVSKAKAAPSQERTQPEAQERSVETKDSDVKKTKRKRVKEQNSNYRGTYSWDVSEGSGGTHLRQNICFIDKDSEVILATDSTLGIYSVNDSSLKRALSLPSHYKVGGVESLRIESFAVSSNQPHLLYATSSMRLYQIDWKACAILKQWGVNFYFSGIQCFKYSLASAFHDVVLTRSQDGDRWELKMISVSMGKKLSNPRTLYVSTEPLSHIECTANGSCITIATRSRLIIGVMKHNTAESIEDVPYSWIEIPTPAAITCLDLKSEFPEHQTPKHSKAAKVDLVTGNKVGVMSVYYNIVETIRAVDQHISDEMSPKHVAKQLHWHRNAVGAVRWSSDGNYIISGGSENTLVLWQLETNKTQFLPHLPASILSIDVSKNGSRYALGLGDNSAIVLATSDLEAKALIVGIQAQPWPRSVFGYAANDFQPLDLSPSDALLQLRSACALSPHRPSNLLLAVPSVREDFTLGQGRPHMQTHDISSNRPSGKQSIARSNVTVKNIGGNNTRLAEPTVYLLKVSSDGQWLATVDTWSPQPTPGDTNSNEHFLRSEVFLKFWKWNQATQDWSLVTRVDKPHSKFQTDHLTGLVFDIASDPTQPGFVTLGEDGIVKFWRPKIRTQDGLVLRASKPSSSQKKPAPEDEEVLTSWSCRRIVRLDNVPIEVIDDAGTVQEFVFGALAYSEDGSAVAAAIGTDLAFDARTDLVHFLDCAPQYDDHRPPHTSPGIISGLPLGMVFLDRYLIALSFQLRVWDVVSDQLMWSYPLDSVDFGLNYTIAAMHIAANTKGGTFAVVVPAANETTIAVAKKGNKAESRRRSSVLAIFEPKSPKPSLLTEVYGYATALLSDPRKTNGYVLLDSTARVRTVAPRSAAFAEKLGTEMVIREKDVPTEKDTLLSVYYDLTSDDARVSGQDENEQQETSGEPTRRPYIDDDDEQIVVPREKLAEVFEDAPTFALPPLGTLFQKVARLFVGKN